MKTALDLASQARGKTAPNPMVGAVVLDSRGQIIGRGFHPQAGQPHAEVFAIRDAQTKLKDLSACTLVVTLEPCNHHGRTPPCVNLILESGIKKVVVGTPDPNPLMQGKSLETLRVKGVEVIEGVLSKESQDLIRGFKSVMFEKRPFITLKCATSLDGKIATSTGESQWITEEPARQLAHQERATHDAILVGVGTVMADDPQLNVRLPNQIDRGLTKVILDSRLMTPPTARLFKTPGRVLIYCEKSYAAERRQSLEKAGAAVLPVASVGDFTQPGLLDLEEVMTSLVEQGVQELLVEGGARVLGAVVREQLFDRVVYFLAPKILGSASRDAFEGLDVKALNESVNIENVTTRQIGKDIVIEGTRACSQV